LPKRPAPRKPTLIERYFQPAITAAQQILDDAGIPDVNHYVRLRADNTIKDDLPRQSAWRALKPEESAITGLHYAEHLHGKDSEQHYAARVVWEFRVLQRAIQDSSNMEFALYLVARLRELVSQWEMTPEMRREARRLEGLQESNLTRREQGDQLRAHLRALAADLRKKHKEASTVELARLIHNLSPSHDTETRLLSIDRIRHLIEGI
jgi:hypothetical protein